jgi:hypothetical protein
LIERLHAAILAAYEQTFVHSCVLRRGLSRPDAARPRGGVGGAAL